MYKLQDLIPGQWYTTKHLNYTFKFSHYIDDNGLIRVYHTRRIYNGSFQDQENYFSNDDMYKEISLASPDIVSRYFPDEIPAINNSYLIF